VGDGSRQPVLRVPTKANRNQCLQNPIQCYSDDYGYATYTITGTANHNGFVYVGHPLTQIFPMQIGSLG